MRTIFLAALVPVVHGIGGQKPTPYDDVVRGVGPLPGVLASRAGRAS